MSAKRGHVDVTSEFIKAGIDVNILDEEGNQSIKKLPITDSGYLVDKPFHTGGCTFMEKLGLKKHV